MSSAADLFGPGRDPENSQLEGRWMRLIAAAPFATAIFDAQLTYAMVSSQWAEIFGLKGQAYLGRRLEEASPECCRELTIALERALSGKSTRRKQERLVDNLGTVRWVRWEARPWRDASESIVGALVYLDDISEITRAGHEAEAQARRLNIALSVGESALIEVDYEQRTVWTSPHYDRLVGHPMSFEEAAREPWPFIYVDDAALVQEAGRGRVDGAPAEPLEARVVGPEGRPLWVRFNQQVEKGDQGEWRKATCLLLNIDERKRQELALVAAERAAKSAIEAKSQFLTSMSHEIRTPMNGVLGLLDVLNGMSLSPEARHLVTNALASGRVVQTLLDDIIDFALLEAGTVKLTRQPLNPAAVLDGMAKLVSSQARAKGIDLRVELAPLPGLVRADPARLRQCLFNLLGNALKFTQVGSITLRATCVEGRHGARLRYEVEDTGPGIDDQMRSWLFEPFEHADGSTPGRIGGAGLGLAITRKLVELMGGKVGVTSKVGVGSTFWFEIPVSEAVERRLADRATMNHPENLRALAGALEGLRVLVVEDNPTNRLITSLMLKSVGVEVSTADDGEQGVEAATTSRFDLILMDIKMPGIDGVEATRRIRASPTVARETPIVALTANTAPSQRALYLEAGMNGVIPKPVSAAALLGAVARLTGEGASQMERAAVASH
jgi:PAS domain S-box-containing protein